jgi:transposase
MCAFGDIARIGVEGTGSYGAGITRHLGQARIEIVEIDRPDHADRRRNGKDDDLDTISAALHNRRSSTPKSNDGAVEALRVLRVTRHTAVRARRKPCSCW